MWGFLTLAQLSLHVCNIHTLRDLLTPHISCPWPTSLATFSPCSLAPVFYIRISFFTSTTSGAPLGIADLATVINDTFPCRAKWYNLGIQLRVDVGTLDSIKVQVQ